MTLRKTLPWLVATLVVAFAVHVASVWYLPHFVMNRALAQMGAVNAIHHGQRADANSHGVVRPSPDLLYSSCPFDLSKGPLRVRAAVPPGTYWSVSAFDDATNNFFVLNDRQAKDSVVDFLIVLRGTHPNTEGFRVVTAPSARGLVLFRTLIDDEKNLAALDALRRQATCNTWHASLTDLSERSQVKTNSAQSRTGRQLSASSGG
jgi:uncharacterized membrane protein